MTGRDAAPIEGMQDQRLPTRSGRAAIGWRSLGRMPYDEALRLQRELAQTLVRGDGIQTVFALEHPPTITIGRSGTRAHIVASVATLEQADVVVREVDRGGDVTYHGFGQLVLYPVLRLGQFGNDIRGYVRRLEQCAIDMLAEVGITGQRQPDYPGVWVGDDKVCAVGVRVLRRPDGEFVSLHGIALNVATELSHFQFIVPCGLTDKGVTSVNQLLGESKDFDFRLWQSRARRSFEREFDVETEQTED